MSKDESVQEQSDRWNPPPVDNTFATLVGTGDEIQGGEEVAESWDDATVAQLKEEIDRRNAERDPDADNYLLKSGKHDDLAQRLEDDDLADEEGDDEEGDDEEE